MQLSRKRASPVIPCKSRAFLTPVAHLRTVNILNALVSRPKRGFCNSTRGKHGNSPRGVPGNSSDRQIMCAHQHAAAAVKRREGDGKTRTYAHACLSTCMPMSVCVWMDVDVFADGGMERVKRRLFVRSVRAVGMNGSWKDCSFGMCAGGSSIMSLLRRYLR
jgi:hypothetical protein